MPSLRSLSYQIQLRLLDGNCFLELRKLTEFFHHRIGQFIQSRRKTDLLAGYVLNDLLVGKFTRFLHDLLVLLLLLNLLRGLALLFLNTLQQRFISKNSLRQAPS